MELWLSSILSGLAAVGLSILFTLFATNRQTVARHNGIRALLTAEQMHNQAALQAFRTDMRTILEEYPGAEAMRAFVALDHEPTWQTLRWETPEVGEVLSSEELMRRGEWYYHLSAIELLYHRLRSQMQARSEVKGNLTAITAGQVRNFADQLSGIIDYADTVFKNPPTVPNSKFETDAGIRSYVEERMQRLAAQRGGESRAEEGKRPEEHGRKAQ
ncbi:MAG TPA: hypothetical protein VF120_14320 [Ktedonobacterales bacterium]